MKVSLNNNIYENYLNHEWKQGMAKNISLIVTEDCNLSCKYCYFVGKNNKNKMSYEIAKKSIDYIINNRNLFPEDSVIWDFIGGEPFLEIDMIDKICNYIKSKTYQKDHPWFNSYRFSFSTNGLLYRNQKVQQYIKKNEKHINIGISIDGTKKKHNLQRVYSNGKGSYNDVIKNIPLWIKQFPNASTKVTVAKEDLKFIKDSVIHLWELGIKFVNINVVFENVWNKDDDEIYYEQLIKLADYILENKLYNDYYCSFFAKDIGIPIYDNQNWCGAGKILAIDYKGNFYPCIRFTKFSLVNKKERRIGNCFNGIDENKLRPFLTLNLKMQSKDECTNCPVAVGCAWCQGVNYDYAETDTIFQRATYICKMHKARVKANNYFWLRLKKNN